MGRTIEVTRQKAVYLVNNHAAMGGMLSKDMKQVLYDGLLRGRAVSLDKGSVLAYTDGRYYVTGYAEDGSDVRFP